MEPDKIAITRGILSLIDEQVNGVAINASERTIVAGGLFDISLEHGKSITALCEKNLFGSGYALIRPMFESFIRAAWCLHCATDQQVSNIVAQDAYPLDLGQLLEQLEEIHYEAGTLNRIKDIYFGSLSRYTNGGILLVFSRFNDEEITHQADGEELRSILNLVLLISFLSVCGIVDISKDPDVLGDFIYDIQQTIFDRF